MTEKRESPHFLSLIIPVYNEQEVLPFLKKRLLALSKTLPCRLEWIFVNDGSKDGTVAFLVEWARFDERVKIVDLARNFGHQAAVTAGIDHAEGDAIVVMDADLQDPPELVHDMVKAYCEGYDVVYAQRSKRLGETFFKKHSANLFYWMMRKFIAKELPMNVGDFRLMSKQACFALSFLREEQRFIRGMISWLGFRQKAILFDRPARIAGTTKYPLRKMVRLAWNSVISFSSAPLMVGFYFGGGLFLLGSLLAFHALIVKMSGSAVPGWASLVVINFLIGGIVLFCLGLIGCYIGRIYEELKARPLYIVRATANLKEKELPMRAVPHRYNPSLIPLRREGERETTVGTSFAEAQV